MCPAFSRLLSLSQEFEECVRRALGSGEVEEASLEAFVLITSFPHLGRDRKLFHITTLKILKGF